MKKATILAATFLALALIVLASIHSPDPVGAQSSDPAATQELCTQQLNAAVTEGEWSRACLSGRRENTYARFYTFTLMQTSAVTITLESRTDTYLYLLAGTGSDAPVFDENDDISSNLNSRIRRTLEPGDYTIEATTHYRNKLGSFTLTVDGVTFGASSGDRVALTALYHATDGDNWERSDNWLTDAPLDEWYGIYTDEQGRVIRLDLEGSNLSGEAPEDIDAISSLLYLNWVNISHNQLTGKLPLILTELAHIEYFYFDNNLSLCASSDVGFQAWAQSLVGFRGDNCADREALIALYRATDGDNWSYSANWLTDAPLDEWHGVVTDEQGRVIKLHLNNNLLTGQLPPGLDDLDRLQALELEGNQLTGPIPPELGNLGELDEILLHNNQLTGSIPPEIGNLDNLVYLSLYQNQLTGSIPPEIGNLENLKSLELSRNQLTGSIPLELGNLDNLRFLKLVYNQLTGCIPADLRGIAYNDFDILNLPFCESAIHTPIPTQTPPPTPIPTQTPPPNPDPTTSECIQPLNATVTEGEWSRECLSGRRENTYARFYTFTLAQTSAVTITLESRTDTYLYLLAGTGSEAPVFDENDDISSNLNSRIRRTLEPGDYTIEATTHYRNKVGSFTLTVDGVTFGALPADRVALIAFYHATDGDNWERSDNWLTQAPLSEWHGIQTDENDRVTEIYLIDNNLSGTLPRELQALSQLKGLFLADNDLSGSIPQELCNLQNLQTLMLSNNNLSGSIPEQIGNLSKLYELHLGRNQLSGSIPTSLGSLENLHGLHLTGNQLSGSIPSALGNLANLRKLSAASNQLSGTIPTELVNLVNLTHIYLWGNELTEGGLTLRLNALDNLQFIDLGDNNIRGAHLLPGITSLENVTGLGLHKSDLTDAELLEYMSELQELNLEFLNLRGNSLSNPQTLAGLSEIPTLQRLAINDNSFGGELPPTMTNLTLMRVFYFHDNPGLCAPADGEFQDWLLSIDDFRGDTCTDGALEQTHVFASFRAAQFSPAIQAANILIPPSRDLPADSSTFLDSLPE